MPRLSASASFLLLVGWLLFPLRSAAIANPGTVKKYIVPPAAVINTFVPNPFVEIANTGCNALGFTMQASPVTWVWKPNPKEDATINFLPFVGMSIVSYHKSCFPDEAADTYDSRIEKGRGEFGLRTQWFPFDDKSDFNYLGFEFAGGSTFGDRGLAGFLGSGLVFGGPMANIGLHYRHGFAKRSNFHNILLGLDVAIPLDLE